MQLGPTAVAPYRAIKMRQRPTVSFAPTGAGAAAGTSAAATATVAPAVVANATGAAALAAVVEQHQLVSWPSLGSFDGVAQLDRLANGGDKEADEEEEVSGGAARSPGGPASSGEAAGAVQRRKRARLSSDGERLAEKLLTAAGAAAAAASPVEAAEAWPAQAAAEAELGPLPPLASMLVPPARGPLRAGGGGGSVKLRRVGSSDVLYVQVHGEQAAAPHAGEAGRE